MCESSKNIFEFLLWEEILVILQFGNTFSQHLKKVDLVFFGKMQRLFQYSLMKFNKFLMWEKVIFDKRIKIIIFLPIFKHIFIQFLIFHRIQHMLMFTN